MERQHEITVKSTNVSSSSSNAVSHSNPDSITDLSLNTSLNSNLIKQKTTKRSRSPPQIEFLPIARQKSSFIFLALGLGIFMILGLCYGELLHVFGMTFRYTYAILNSINFVISFISVILFFYLSRQFFKASDALLRAEKNFDVLLCECSFEEDKVVLLYAIMESFQTFDFQKIDENFANEIQGIQDGIERFNLFVRYNLKKTCHFNFFQGCQ